MRIFRLEHAGLVVEHDERSLFIDPGSFSSAQEIATAIDSAPQVEAIVITHEHGDHWTPEHIAALRKANVSAPIYTTAATAQALAATGIGETTVVHAGERLDAGPFSLEFYGGRHAMLHSSIPVIDNVGVRVNEQLAWGGDSLINPPFAPDVLGVPIGSPWANLAEILDFVLDTRPGRIFFTHDALLSEPGHALYAARVASCLDQIGGELLTFPRLTPDPGARREL